MGPIPAQSSEILSSLLQVLVFLLFFSSVKPATFNYPSFESVPRNISLQGNASSTSGFIQLTTNRRDALLNNSIGRAVYAEPVRLWDSGTGIVADFSTHFQFAIDMLFPPDGADGLAFFIAPNGSLIPPDSGGNCLGLYRQSSRFNSSDNPVVAVEFDTFPNEWDPRRDHVGINVNSIRSVATWNTSSLKNGSTANVWVIYNSTTQNFSVYLTFAQNPIFNGNSILSYTLDLKRILPEWITVGFSGATGSSFEVHNILSWEFNSTEFPSNPGSGGVSVGKKKSNTKVMIGSTVGGSVFAVGLGLLLFCWWKRKNGKKYEDDSITDIYTDEDYEKGTGPKRFHYNELVVATNNFAEEGKLGEGGFGGVYRGDLTDPTMGVAVKRVSRESRQGKKEFVSEVKIISQLRHRNLVQLIGWCHERGEFLLVYEFMPNGSLDFHLFGGRTMLTWVSRHKIALGLASALLYLHEEWEQCVVHRDIKSSNVMLDSNFNAKLGDFGLARFVDHGLGVKTTMLAGTMGYLAPECVLTGKAGKESDVYSFGVVALEIACGRRAVEHNEEEGKVGLVAWAWELYGSGRLLEAVDNKLGVDYDENQIQRLMVVGLWCANLDHTLRPSIKQAISVLNFETPLPDLPFKMFVPTHFTPLHSLGVSNASSSATDTQGNQSQVSYDSYNTDSSHMSTSASVSLLQLATR
ncbi:non-specific serine/threonine protein kinase [Ranunculus cassubicifolius]